MLEIIIL